MTERFLSVGGSHGDIGRLLGRGWHESIREALQYLYEELAIKASVEHARQQALEYLPFIQNAAPHLAEELDGLAGGAGISLAEALILQLRFELVGFGGEPSDGCSSLAIVDAGHRLTGQNVDAPAWHKQMGRVVEMRTPEGPDLLFYSYYPGMLGYLGINSAGLSVFANAVLSAGWRVGFPRYLALRLALEQESVAAAWEVLRGLHRASTINLVLTDSGNQIMDLELDVEDVGPVYPVSNRIFHTNHYCNSSLVEREALLPLLPDTVPRLQRGEELLYALALSSNEALACQQIRTVLTDHANGPSSICRHRAEPSRYPADQWESVASIIAQPARGTMAVSFGNPCESPYHQFAFTSVGAGTGLQSAVSER